MKKIPFSIFLSPSAVFEFCFCFSLNYNLVSPVDANMEFSFFVDLCGADGRERLSFKLTLYFLYQEGTF